MGYRILFTVSIQSITENTGRLTTYNVVAAYGAPVHSSPDVMWYLATTQVEGCFEMDLLCGLRHHPVLLLLTSTCGVI